MRLIYFLVILLAGSCIAGIAYSEQRVGYQKFNNYKNINPNKEIVNFPRNIESNDLRLQILAPKIYEWKAYSRLDFWIKVIVELEGLSQPVVGVIRLHTDSRILSNEDKQIVCKHKIVQYDFPNIDVNSAEFVKNSIGNMINQNPDIFPKNFCWPTIRIQANK